MSEKNVTAVAHYEKEASATIYVTLNYSQDTHPELPDNEYMERRLRNMMRRLVHDMQNQYDELNIGWDEQIVVEDRGAYILEL